MVGTHADKRCLTYLAMQVCEATTSGGLSLSRLTHSAAWVVNARNPPKCARFGITMRRRPWVHDAHPAGLRRFAGIQHQYLTVNPTLSVNPTPPPQK